MKYLKKLYSLFNTFLDFLSNFLLNILVPEDKRVARLIKMDQSKMRSILVKSVARVQNLSVLFDYNNANVRLLIKTLKYKNNAGVRKKLAAFLYEEIVELASDITLFTGSPPILVPMPMSRDEKSKKGFNQCEELCKEIAKLSGGNIIVSYDALKKVRETKRQTSLGREARLKNVANSMLADQNLIKDQTIIVLDDVYTTLATFSEARRALLASSARSVFGLFLAH